VIRYLLDTNICIEMIRGRGDRLYGKLVNQDVGISCITLAELQFGAAKSSNPERNSSLLIEFCSPLEIIPFDHAAAATYGDLRFELEKSGFPIGPLDTLIAAHARSMGITIVTNNEREFKRVRNLKVENWLK
jgi:tRNA(fMet)-specific endonuclease VapC